MRCRGEESLDPSFYSNEPDRLFRAIASGPWKQIGVISHVPTDYVSEPEGEELIDQLRRELAERTIAILHFDPNFSESRWHELPCLMASRASPNQFDALILLSPRFSEVLFH